MFDNRSAFEIRKAILNKDPKFKGELGAGKGREPFPWCKCHNRNPCPRTDSKLDPGFDPYKAPEAK